ncbi:MAG: 5-(carboxyamino)imidazole ribonucleotide synthase [Kaiparowitsia implicata GSE-PSE-MK54-09C]|jgi:5-(carboxyamino)imidazole ribonucleotide synthase|nr:5-(carboxyamino)imidazole ribonucleotide synthase [Kaiparowitsia implicata GSE-PSE-MK54-09C]
MEKKIDRVGVIGGGQLAWMLATSARALGLMVVVQTPSADDPAVGLAAAWVRGEVTDAIATAQLSQAVDVITFENEFVDLAALKPLEQQGVRFSPCLGAIAPVLDKFHQRSFFRTHRVPTPRFVDLSPQPTTNERSQMGFPVVMKARRHGYDGYGTFICATDSELVQRLHESPEQTWLLEEFVPFERELAVMAARSSTGEIAVYPVVETQQDPKSQVCRVVYALDEWPDAITKSVQAIAHALLTALNYVGILGIELFLTADGAVLVNEIAPRTHNSGHYTLDACATSQFEQQLRAVCGLPLGDTALIPAGAVMVNLLGFESAESDYAGLRQQIAALPHTRVYWYGKAEARPGRKLGHVTTRLQPGQQRADAAAIAHQIEALWYGAVQSPGRAAG